MCLLFKNYYSLFPVFSYTDPLSLIILAPFVGPNPLFGGLKNAESVFGKTDSLWVEGEGMLHALHFKKDSKGKWSSYYINRYVETETYKMESKRKKPAFLPVADGDARAIFAGLFFNKVEFPYFMD